MLYPKFVDRFSRFYQEPHRSYHSMSHVHTLTRLILTRSYEQFLIPGVKLDTFSPTGLTDFLMITAWTHDAYYDPYLGSPLNEYMSRLLYREHSAIIAGSATLSKEEEKILSYAEYAIDLTSKHTQYIGEYIPETNNVFHLYSWPMCLEMFLFMDLDMFGFYDEDEFRLNNKTVREEYYKTSDNDYRIGREKFLQTLLDKPRIMYLMNDHVEDTIRANLTRSLNDPLY